MSGSRWIAVGALWAGIGVALGAFGAHALRESLELRGKLDDWETAVTYQVWHALALIAYGLDQERRMASSVPPLLFLIGSLLFSGSIYALAMDVAASFLWPLTPLGGLLLLAAWALWALGAWRDA
jgi:uncharacterized membrane protein YgdD (TMEM256/DUF423 family)